MALPSAAICLSGSLGMVFAFCDSARVLRSKNVKDKHAISKSCKNDVEEEDKQNEKDAAFMM
eukprot:3137639-Ditylum_brightwellii.AAC.1